MDYVIIGAGPAGLAAAATLRERDRQGRVTILSNEKFQPYAKMGLPYLLHGATTERDLTLAVPDGVKLMLGQKVRRIEPERKRVVATRGKVFTYDKLLIATGSTPQRPDIPGSKLPFVFTVRDLPDIHGIRARVSGRTGRAVIAGAGPVGMELADALHKIGVKVTLVISSDRFFSTMLDLPASELIEQTLTAQGIQIRKKQDILKVKRNGQVVLRSGEVLEADPVIFGKGVRPTTGFLAGSGLECEWGIPVDEHQETKIKGIYAAGDCTETRDVVYHDQRCNALWPTAVEQGNVAALNMAGIPVAYRGSIGRNVMRVFGLSIFAAGMGKMDRPAVRQEKGPDFYHKIVLDEGKLAGAIFVGEFKNEGVYVNLMQREIDVAPYAGTLLRGAFSFPRFLALGINGNLGVRSQQLDLASVPS